MVTLTLNGATYEPSIVTIRNAVAVSGITGVTIATGGVIRGSDTVITVPLAFDGTNLAPNATLTFTVAAGAIAGYRGPRGDSAPTCDGINGVGSRLNGDPLNRGYLGWECGHTDT